MKAVPTLLFLTHDVGFFLSHRLPVAKAAVAKGFAVAVAGPDEGHALALAEHKIRHIPLSMPRGLMNPIGQLQSIGRIWSLLEHERPDIVHLIASKPVIIGGVMSRMLGLSSVAAVSGLGHVFIDPSLRSRIVRQIVLLGYRFAIAHSRCHTIFQNETNRQLMLGIGVDPARTILIPGSGTDVGRFDPSPAENTEPLVLLPARMLWTKGVGEFCEAAKILKASGTMARFRMVGDPYRGNPASLDPGALRKIADGGVVEWAPHTNRIEAELRQSDIVVLPSHGEGFPKTLIDAAAAGRAVVTTNLPGCRDAIIPGETGLLVEPHNAADLAAKIGVLVGDPDLRRRMGAAGRKLAEQRYRIEDVVEGHLRLYAAALSDAPDRP